MLFKTAHCVLFKTAHFVQLFRVEDVAECQWSGGFSLDKDRSFHVLMRGSFGHSVFVRCQVTLIGATYRIILSDAANYPPPLRLENLSQVPVTYHQQNRTLAACTLNPGQSIPYAWDEPMLPEVLCVQVKGVNEIKEFEFNTFGTRGKLYYESYFYVCAGGGGVRGGESPQLVLDVPQGTAVIFQQKVLSNRKTRTYIQTID